MALDLGLLALVCVVAGIGATRGTLASATHLVVLLGAYATAVAAAPTLGPGLARAAGWSGALGAAIAGLLAFAGTHVVLGLVGAWVRGREAGTGDSERGALDRTGGGFFGAVRGALFAALLAWLALLADGLRVAGAAPALPPLGESRAATLTGSAVEAGAHVMFGADPTARVVARVAARPAASLEEFDALLADPLVIALSDDALFWTSVEHGDVDRALHRASWVRLARDARLRARLHRLGLVDADSADDPSRFRDEMAELLAELGPRLRALREDPDVVRLLEDPELLEAARTGDSLAIAGDPRVRAIVSRAIAAR